ncbi:NAD(P)-dependent oxidoreductase [Paenibacillus albilobatus]|uniref:dTDP-4-dehydrorhamnose reductase n=1 Tax=Paenibacillus albilobatus TaxID=2716884 RepID=A0A919XLC3_9BACL|nr:dTDP-4-dehydrorhamnose reductase [Paenibacillus albilobatus]GIO35106.1 NAD(P)-dependent oxidoreductase [Paenibacillus albilobatus]
MRVVVTGANGQLGHDVVQSLKNRGGNDWCIHVVDFDLTDMSHTKEYLYKFLPDVVIHCAAFTDVDAAEHEQKKCWTINVDVTANIASACNSINAKLVYISTDYVFSGEEEGLYEVYSKPDPISVYGETKLAGEKKVAQLIDSYFIVRTSWAYGVNGDNFVQAMLRIGEKEDSVNVVADQFGSPTFTEDLANFIIDLIKSDKYGIYHATNEGFCSWAQFAVEIFNQVGYPTKVNFIKSEDYFTFAKRPKNSRLSKKSLDDGGFSRLPEWREALRRYLTKRGF